MNQLVISLIRTYVPVIVGAGLAWLSTSLGIVDLDVQGAQALGVAVVTGVYYLLVRVAEQRWPEAGALLGHRSQPDYTRDAG